MIYTPTDLHQQPFVSNSPKFAVFGKPIAHSLSPLMQNKALEEISKTNSNFADAKYYAFEIDSEDLINVLKIFHDKNFVGINLTIPHKEVVLPALTEVDSTVECAQACNTLMRTDNGWRGFNTDGIGLEYAISHSLNRGIKDADIVLLGAGGAARASALHMLTNGCKSLTIANRSQERMQKLVSDIRSKGFECKTLKLSADMEIPENSIVINATSIGLKNTDSPILDFTKFPKTSIFFDMPYIRQGETTSVQSARENGIKAHSGLPMLAWQGAKSMSIWTNYNFESIAKTMYNALGL